MNLISREELKARLDRGDNFKLVMVLNAQAFHASHIPGSINASMPDEWTALLAKDDEIVVYCSDVACNASRFAYIWFEQNGYTNVYRFAGGLADWEDAGYPLEGELVR